MTFSIVGRCERTGELGTAIASPSMAIGNRCLRVRSGVGAVVTQNAASPKLAREALDYMQSGLGPTSTLNLLTVDREHVDFRQLLMVDNEGKTGHFSGHQIKNEHATSEGTNAVAGGCGLVAVMVPSAMIVAFEQLSDAPLASRLISALEAGYDLISEDHDTHSAALLVAGDQDWPLVDLRVDWHQSAPVAVLRGLWEAYQVEVDTVIADALAPGANTSQS
jgi:uncharacterized Ntn-hydrolase superfamily protein